MSAKLYIPKPCHENWDKMTATEKGRHCDVCQKVVKDLTGLNKIQTLQVLANSGEKEVCGRVNTAILDVQPKKWDILFTYMKRYGTRALAFLGFVAIDKKLNAQHATVGMIIPTIVEEKQENRKFKVELQVKDEQGNNVQFAHVQLTGKNNRKMDMVTDSLGRIKATVNESEFGNGGLNLTIDCMGFESKIFNDLYFTKLHTKLEIILKTSVTELPAYNFSDESIKLKRGENTAGTMVIRMGGLSSCEEVAPTYDYNNDTDEDKSNVFAEEPLQFKCYPDPTIGLFTVECNKDHVFDIQIFDNSGKMLVAMFQIGNRKEIDLTGNAPGIYYVTILENGTVMDTKKVILVR